MNVQVEGMISPDDLQEVKHYYEGIKEEERTKQMNNALTYRYYYHPSSKRIYRKSSVSPWLEKYLRYDDAEYLDIMRYNNYLSKKETASTCTYKPTFR